MMKTTEPLPVGTIAAWTSQAAGTTTTKTGQVIGFIPKWRVPSGLYPDLQSIAKAQDKLGSGIHGSSQNDRYLVRVDRTSKSGQPLQPWYYAPRASAVKVKEQES